MALFTPEDLEDDILNDLREEIFELYESSIQNLVELELTPSDNEMQRALFRSVHTIKGDLGLVGFTPMIEVLQYLEDVLDLLRKGEIVYSTPLHDFVVRLLDKVSVFVEDCTNNGKAEYDKEAIDATSAIIKKVTNKNPSEHDALLKQAINAFTNAGDDVSSDNSAVELPKTGVPKDLSPEKQQDLLFFRDLMRSVEKRCGHKEGKGDRVAALALYVNDFNQQEIAPDQLAAASYSHDFGLAFMPQEIVNKDKKDLTDLEQNLLRSNVYKSTRLLEHLPAWDDARKIVMQHRERHDGSGYPLGIAGDQICEGAQLLSIVESYISLVGDSKERETEVQAVIKLNKEYKTKFSAKWLRIFNNAMTKYLS